MQMKLSQERASRLEDINQKEKEKKEKETRVNEYNRRHLFSIAYLASIEQGEAVLLAGYPFLLIRAVELRHELGEATHEDVEDLEEEIRLDHHLQRVFHMHLKLASKQKCANMDKKKNNIEME
jgi:hypothetical protein